MSYLKKVKPKENAQKSIEVIMAKLKADRYENAAYKEADRKMLEHYLNGGV